MFIGHYALALAAKRTAPRVNLGILVTAAQLIDLMWPVFLLTGIERVNIEPGNTAFTPLAFTYYPISHSLALAAGWGLLFGLAYFLLTRYGTGALVVGLLVPSHWLLDAIVHRPDLPLFPGKSPLIGLGLWNNIPATLAVEGALFAAGLWLYLRSTEARDKIGTFGLTGLVVVLLAIYFSSAFGSPPPSVRALAWIALGQWLFVLWAGWVDRHRSVIE